VFTSPESFAGFAEQFLNLISVQALTIYAVSPEGDSLDVWFSTEGAPAEDLPVSHDSVAGYVAEEGRTVRFDRIDPTAGASAAYPGLDLQTAFTPPPQITSILACPIASSGTVSGVVTVVNSLRPDEGGRFSDQDVQAVRQLANQFAEPFAAVRPPTPEAAPPETSLPEDGDAPQAQVATGITAPFEELVSHGLISADMLKRLGQVARPGQASLGRLLIAQADLTIEQVGACLEDYYNVPFMTYDPAIEIPSKLLESLNREFLARRCWLPLAKSATQAIILIDDPNDAARVLDITKVLGVQDCEVRMALPEDIHRFIYPEKHREPPPPEEDDAPTGSGLDQLIDDLRTEDGIANTLQSNATELLDQDAPTVVQIVNRLIAEAIQENASDIHIEPGMDGRPGIARMRIDGICHDVLEIPAGHMRAVLSRIKVMADLDITERRLPQDGKLTVRNEQKVTELRVATVPTVSGESAVLRILAGGDLLHLAQLGLSPANEETIRQLVQRPHGIFLVVGPTGSGKTTTLHAVLGHVNTPQKKIWTAEDPVEIRQERLQQVQMQPRIGLTFATALRSFLRSDPDVILIGEMRDLETAHAAVEASLTGHLVLSTLHTNSAAETLTRLVDIGIDAISFSDALIGVLAQRLVRRLCSSCRERYTPTPDELDVFVTAYGEEHFDELGISRDSVELYRAVGCGECRGTGYSGRLGIHELLVGSTAIKEMVIQGAPASDLREAAISEGMRTLRQDGLAKVLKGDTDLHQIWTATVA
jgi:type II secretory ATPase GspE/PulE/Tfp pilus assembly ATPase PilB-like protein